MSDYPHDAKLHERPVCSWCGRSVQDLAKARSAECDERKKRAKYVEDEQRRAESARRSVRQQRQKL